MIWPSLQRLGLRCDYGRVCIDSDCRWVSVYHTLFYPFKTRTPLVSSTLIHDLAPWSAVLIGNLGANYHWYVIRRAGVGLPMAGFTAWRRHNHLSGRTCSTHCPLEPILLTWFHDDVLKWKHFPRYWPVVRGNNWSPVNSHHKGQWRGALMFSLICTWINGWVNNREVGALRRSRAHCDVNVMFNFNPSMGKWSHAHEVWDEITYPFPNFNGATVEVWG